MARRGNSITEETTVETSEVADETTTPTVEAPAETEAPEADLTDFKAAVDAAVKTKSDVDGEVPEEGLKAVNEAYRAIDGVKGKNAARSFIEDQMKASIVGSDIITARAYVMLKDNLSAGSSSAPKTPADPTTAFVQKVVSLQLALNLVTETVPEGVSEDWAEKADELVASVAGEVNAYGQWLSNTDDDEEAPEVSPVVRQAFKLSQGKTAGGSGRVAGGPRRDIKKHMNQVFADLEVGAFLTVNEIAKLPSTEYGDDRPSAGAVSARLFPKGKDAYVGDVIKAVAEDGKSRGAVKIA